MSTFEYRFSMQNEADCRQMRDVLTLVTAIEFEELVGRRYNVFIDGDEIVITHPSEKGVNDFIACILANPTERWTDELIEEGERILQRRALESWVPVTLVA